MIRLSFLWRWIITYVLVGLIYFVLKKLFGWPVPSYEFGAITALVLTLDRELEDAS